MYHRQKHLHCLTNQLNLNHKDPTVWIKTTLMFLSKIDITRTTSSIIKPLNWQDIFIIEEMVRIVNLKNTHPWSPVLVSWKKLPASPPEWISKLKIVLYVDYIYRKPPRKQIPSPKKYIFIDKNKAPLKYFQHSTDHSLNIATLTCRNQENEKRWDHASLLSC